MNIPLFLCLSLTLVAESPAASGHGVLKRDDLLTSSIDTFHLYTRNNSVPDEIRLDNFKDLDKSHFQPEKPSFIIIGDVFHDFGIPKSKNIRSALLQTKDPNVFNLAYPSVLLPDTNPITEYGTIVANFVNYIGTNYGVPVSNFKFIGYDVGAYVAAHAGNLLKGKIASIVGLDPDKDLARIYPLIFNLSTKAIILHTSLGGVQTNVGNIDVYFNGGRYQPNCGLFEPIRCAHLRAYEYYRRAILDLRIIATICDSYANFVGGACDNNKKVSVGSLVLDGTPSGTYHLNYTF